jgi:hypothetical protein
MSTSNPAHRRPCHGGGASATDASAETRADSPHFGHLEPISARSRRRRHDAQAMSIGRRPVSSTGMGTPGVRGVDMTQSVAVPDEDLSDLACRSPPASDRTRRRHPDPPPSYRTPVCDHVPQPAQQDSCIPERAHRPTREGVATRAYSHAPPANASRRNEPRPIVKR